MSDDETPHWLKRMMERDPTASDPAPMDDLTKHRMFQYMREIGQKENTRDERLLSLLWPRWALVRHPLSHHALALAMSLIEDMDGATGEIEAMRLAAMCNFAFHRFADLQPAWDKAPLDLAEQIGDEWYSELPGEERVSVTENRYQHVADALGLSARPDWPELDRCVRAIFAMREGETYEEYDDQPRADLLYNVVWRICPRPMRN